MSNSTLICGQMLSPFHSGRRNHRIDTITPHCMVGQISAEVCGRVFQTSGASSNYGIGADGRIMLYVDEENRSWCSSSAANDNRAVTIECASDKTSPFAMRQVVWDNLVALCVDICDRNGKTKLLWLGSKERTLAYTPDDDEMVLSAHRWFANKECPGDWLYSRYDRLADEVTKQLQNEDKNGDLDYTLVYDEAFYRNRYGDEVGSGVWAFLNFLDKMDVGRRGNFWFDPVWYRQHNADLQAAFGNQWRPYYEHWMRWGLTEGRWPIDISAIFDWRYYRETYADLDAAFGDDDHAYATHFLIYGMIEGRQACASFNPEAYRLRYSDLNKAFGDDWRSYYRHYLEYGIKEGRRGD